MMPRPKTILAALLIGVASLAPAVPASAADPVPCRGAACGGLVFFGTHGNSIYAARLDPRTGALHGLGVAADLERPTWMVATPDRKTLYSVSETGNDGKSEASVASYAIDRASGKLTLKNKISSGGGGSTHLSLDMRSRTLFVASFGTGTVSALPLLADGSLGPVASKLNDYGTGPKARQASPHSHAVAIDPSGRYVLSADLGADRTFVYRFDPKTRVLSANEPPFTTAAPGSGPRHIEFLPGGRFVYVNSELSGEVTRYAWDARGGTMKPLGTISTVAPSFTGERSSAEMGFSRDGRFLYVSNRNEDVIVTYSINPRDAALTEVQRIPSGGKTPWSFAIDPTGGWMLVAHEASNMVTVLKVDQRTGKLSPTDKSLAIPTPVNVVFGPK